MDEPTIRVLGLGVALDGRRVLDGVSLTVEAGRVAAVVGPNGAGKTTLLRALAGLAPADGELVVAGLDPRRASAADNARLRAYCAQKPTSAWDYRVGDLGEIVGNPAGFAHWLTQLRLDGFAGRNLAGLSGGEQKAAHLAMAFASLGEPFGAVLLLDEPAAALDLARQEAVRQAVLSFAHAGAACVLATHDLGHARDCDQVVVLDEGRMIAAGAPADALTPAIIAGTWGATASPAR